MKLNVLLVEDNEDHIHFIKQTFKDQFYLKIIKDGQQAYDYLLKEKPDVLILDHRLPSLNGLEILEKLQKKGKNCATLFLTMENSVDMAVNAMQLGASDFLPKKGEFYKVILPKIKNIHRIYTAALKLEESEDKYRILFETMVQGVVYQNADGNIISANKAAENILGLTMDQMQGRTSIDPRWQAIHEDRSDFPGTTHPAIVSLKTGKPVHETVMGIYHPVENQYTWISVDAIPQFRDGEKKPYQVF